MALLAQAAWLPVVHTLHRDVEVPMNTQLVHESFALHLELQVVEALGGAHSTSLCISTAATICRRPFRLYFPFPLRRAFTCTAMSKSIQSTTETGPVIIDGNATAATIRSELTARIAALSDKRGRAPGLAVVLVGSRTDSATYVRMKKKACAEVGIVDFGRDLPTDTTQEDVINTVRELNADPRVDGILVQLPLPSHINETAVLDAISHEKDADGLHPLNVGMLVLKGRTPSAISCTPWVRAPASTIAYALSCV